MTTFTVSSHNMLFTLDNKRWREDLAKSKMAIAGYQEAEGEGQRKTLTAWHLEQDRGLYHPENTGNPIGWRIDLFTPTFVEGRPFAGTVRPHLGAARMGVEVKFNGARDFTWVGLTHQPTGKHFLVVNVHPVAQATKPESDPTYHETEDVTIWKDWAITQYWLDVLSFVAHEMSRQVPGRTELRNFWDGIIMLGDYNAALSARDAWYYPGRMLRALFHNDPKPAGLDHIQRTYGSDLVPGKRYTKPGHTDHPLQFQEFTVKNVVDRPRIR